MTGGPSKFYNKVHDNFLTTERQDKVVAQEYQHSTIGNEPKVNNRVPIKFIIQRSENQEGLTLSHDTVGNESREEDSDEGDQTKSSRKTAEKDHSLSGVLKITEQEGPSKKGTEKTSQRKKRLLTMKSSQQSFIGVKMCTSEKELKMSGVSASRKEEKQDPT